MTVGELGNRLVLSEADQMPATACLVQTPGFPDPGEGATGRLLESRALTCISCVPCPDGAPDTREG